MAHAFADEQAALDAKQAELETAELTLAEMVEEQLAMMASLLISIR